VAAAAAGGERRLDALTERVARDADSAAALQVKTWVKTNPSSLAESIN
jgi:hypothetical protein